MSPSVSALTVRYASTRAELWRAYWRAWARSRGLWRVHAGIVALAMAIAASYGARSADCLAAGAIVAGACLIVFPLVPQLKFKPAERTLTIDATGWHTAIGAMSGTRPWREVRAVVDTGAVIEITGTNGNALVVPRRAFADDAARVGFLQAALAWQAAARR